LATEPYSEPATLAALRFVLEVAAWVAIYFAWGWIPFALALAALSVFSVPGDKHMVLIQVGGRMRILLEVLVALAGLVAAVQAWFLAAAGVLLVANVFLFAASRARLHWLWQH
jgi:hypothetical protein